MGIMIEYLVNLKRQMKRATNTPKPAAKAGKPAARKAAARSGDAMMTTAVRFAIKRPQKGVQRVGAKSFVSMVRSAPLGMDDWARVMFITPRTLQNRISRNSEFDELESDRMILVMQVMDKGKEVFGNEEAFKRWINSPRPALGGLTPLDSLNSLAGIGEVLAELGRIEHGVF
jgi:putative toxin-antitoxin system antitoxin component (TIGR02293 family)